MAKIHSEIKAPVALADVGGALHSFVFGQVIRGYKINYAGGEVILYGLDSTNQPTFAELASVVVNGGSFRGIKLGIEFVNLTAAQQNVPVEVRGATYTDENEEVQNRTWVQWFQANSQQAYRHTSGDPYIIKAVYLSNLLNSVELELIHAMAGIEVLEWVEMQSRMQSEDYEIV